MFVEKSVRLFGQRADVEGRGLWCTVARLLEVFLADADAKQRAVERADVRVRLEAVAPLGRTGCVNVRNHKLS